MSELHPQNGAEGCEFDESQQTNEQRALTEMQELRRFVGGVCGVIGDFVKTELRIRRGDY